jgi:hypothetical protein
MNEGLECQNWWKCHRNITNKEWKKCQAKGCCFLCGHQGHIHCYCPKKNDGKGKEWEHKAQKAALSINTSEEQKSDDGYAPLEPLSYKSKKFLGQMKALDKKECKELLKRIMDELGF